MGFIKLKGRTPESTETAPLVLDAGEHGWLLFEHLIGLMENQALASLADNVRGFAQRQSLKYALLSIPVPGINDRSVNSKTLLTRPCIFESFAHVVMAETAGLVVGVVSVAALFNSCVECFEYLRFGKSFGRDYQTCQLRLDAAKLRISRWGEAVNIHQNARLAAEPVESDRDGMMAFSYFEEIHHLIQGVQRSSKRYQLIDPARDATIATSSDMTLVGSDVHNRATEISRRRQRNAKKLDKLIWALYDGKEFNRMITQIMTLVDELEKILPVEPACQQLVQLEINEFDDEISLATLQQGAEQTDQALYDAIAQKMLLISGSNSAGAIQTEAFADVQIGNQYTAELLARGLSATDKTRNSSRDISAGGNSKVQIGNRFG